MKVIKRAINDAIRRNKEEESKALTKAFAATYATWLEGSLLKIIHTPEGFTDDEISQIKKEAKVESRWIKTVELTFRKFNRSKRSNEVPNKTQKIKRLIDEYIISPSLIRNKIMHGQWEIALNRENTRINPDLTQEIQALTSIDVYKWYWVSEKIVKIIEDLIKANPNNGNWAHYKDYHVLLQEIEEFEDESSDWNENTKAEKLTRKKRKVSPDDKTPKHQ